MFSYRPNPTKQMLSATLALCFWVQRAAAQSSSDAADAALWAAGIAAAAIIWCCCCRRSQDLGGTDHYTYVNDSRATDHALGIA